MSFKRGEPNTRKYRWRFTVEQWIEFRERYEALKASGEIEEIHLRILYEIIFNHKTTAELAFLAENDQNYQWLQSQMKRPMSCRRIQQIACEYYPEFHTQTSRKQEKDPQKEKLRQEQQKLKYDLMMKNKRCGVCGTDKQLEVHHLFPVMLGGDNDKRNLVLLCKTCHRNQSDYFMERIRESIKEINELREKK